MILLQKRTDFNTYQKHEYALAVYPVMHQGRVYMTSSRVVLIENVNILGDIQRYILPGQRSSCKPHHLVSIHKIQKTDQDRASASFDSVLFYESLEEAGRAMGIVFQQSSASVYGSSQEDSSGG